jgi:hypothetical protein
MKKITLLVAANLLVGSLAFATTDERAVAFDRTRGAAVHYMDAEPIVFMERGIEFFVFLNGDFDFNTRPQDSQGGYFYRRGASARGNGAVAVNYGVRIEHDSFGRVRRVGNTFVNYDQFNRVTRIGSIYMRYNNFALTQIGGMQIAYNRRGQIAQMIGQVNYRRGNAGFTTTAYYGSSDYAYQNGTTYNDDSYYYYRADGTKALKEDDK